MYKMGWSYADLYQCPPAHLEALVELFKKESEHGHNRR